MGTEIERKFRVEGDGWRSAPGRTALAFRQGYLSTDKARTVRVRLEGARGVLTIKGPTTGARRSEFEYEVPAADAEELLALCIPPLIDKVRHRIPVGTHVFEVDEFLGDNAGLVIAEVELGAEDEVFTRPAWLGVEVTTDARYYNSNLIAHPYRTWSGQG